MDVIKGANKPITTGAYTCIDLYLQRTILSIARSGSGMLRKTLLLKFVKLRFIE